MAFNKDKDVPRLILEFAGKKHTKGYRSSLLYLLSKYDCSNIKNELLELFLKDSFNTTFYLYDILVDNIKKYDIKDLINLSSKLVLHISIEKDGDKLEYQYLLLKKVNRKINKINKNNC